MHTTTTVLSLLPLVASALALVPKTTTVLSTVVKGCKVPVSAAFTSNNTALNIKYDTTKDSNPLTNSLSSIDAAGNYTDTTCIVCSALQWSDELFGFVGSVEYDFDHRLDPGLLEQIDTRAGVEGGLEEGYYESSYIYGGPETAKTQHVHSTQLNASDPLLLDSAHDHESLCIRTIFRVMARGGYVGPAGELSKESVFTQTLNIEWKNDKSSYCQRDRTGLPVCYGNENDPACCKIPADG